MNPILTAHVDSVVHSHNPLTDPVFVIVISLAIVLYLAGARIMARAQLSARCHECGCERGNHLTADSAQRTGYRCASDTDNVDGCSCSGYHR